jgi:hypothetical protein
VDQRRDRARRRGRHQRGEAVEQLERGQALRATADGARSRDLDLLGDNGHLVRRELLLTPATSSSDDPTG